LLKGKTIVHLLKTHSEVPGKFKAGGQSAPRFARQREGAAVEHYKKVAEYAKEQLLHLEGLKGIIIGGPGPTKYEFFDGDYLTGDLKKKVLAVKDIGYTEEFGVEELVEKSADVLANEEVAGEKKVMGEFFDKLAKKPTMVAYGEIDTMNKVRMGIADKLLISDALEENKIEEFEKEAQKFGTEVIIISTETREGVQLKEIGGVAAILRYELHQ
jgi:peptide chain release factor subunit 1